MDGPYVSPELFHFVGRAHPNDDDANYAILSKVLASETVSHSPHERGWGIHSYSIDSDGRLFDGSLIVPTMTCYCDIPFTSLGIHVAKYGKFGISFRREPLISYGARPVMYVPIGIADSVPTLSGQYLLRDIETTYHGFMQHVVKDQISLPREIGEVSKDYRHAVSAVRTTFEMYFLAFVKPYDASLADDDPNNFYMEREWRKFGNFHFAPGGWVEREHIVHVVAPAAYVGRLSKDFPAYASKITPLESATLVPPSAEG